MGEILIGILREIIGGIIQGAMESLFLKYKKLTFGLISISWILSGCILVKMFADTEWWKILLVSGAIAVFATFIIELLIYLIGKVVGKFKWLITDGASVHACAKTEFTAQAWTLALSVISTKSAVGI